MRIGRESGGREVGAGNRAATARCGLRRVDCVRFVVDREGVRAEAVGVGFRLPVSRPIPLSMAAELIDAGTPHVTSSPRRVGA